MKKIYSIFLLIVLFTSMKQYGQHHSKMTVAINPENKTLTIFQELTFFNQTQDSLNTIILNDWNNAYSSKNSLLAKRFSDEFIRNFHLSSEKQKGFTKNITVFDENDCMYIISVNNMLVKTINISSV